jgi:alkylation response protein AidB-like acyl-CoA dehydrogenase
VDVYVKKWNTPEVAVVSSELTDLRTAVRGTLDRHWPAEGRLGRDDAALATVWEEAVGLGWAELDEQSAEALLPIVDELGAANCAIPLVDAIAAAAVLRGTELGPKLGTGELTVVVGAEHLDAGALATHVLVLPDRAGTARLHEAALESTPALAPYGWARLTTGSEPVLEVEVDASTLAAARRVLRFGLTARALGAARRAHALAIEHACTREQFGGPIGRFQAVSHRAASGLVDLESSRLLLEDAAAGSLAPLPTALAVEHGLAAAPRVLLGAMHTLGGMGFHDEHEGAWLFRRTYADVARAADFADAEDPATMLIDQGLPQPDVDLGERANAFRAEISAVFDESWSGDRTLTEDAQFDPVLRDRLVERGWLAAGWPREWGGQERTPEELLALNEEIRYRGIPVRRLFTTANIVGGAIMRHGTDEQKRRFLPGIRNGETLFCLGYSEPGAGSDLASLRTSARKVDGGWIVNGQKIFTTFGHRSHYHWLAVRTDPEAAPPHAGISLFIVPLDSDGITIQENRALNGETTTTTFYDDVFVSDDALVGELNGGWQVIGTALSVERVAMGGNVAELRALLDRLIAAMRAEPERLAGPVGSWQRREVAELAAWLRAVRLFVVAGLKALAEDRPTRLPAAMAKIAGGETAERLADAALRILGPDAALKAGAIGAILDGEVERILRLAPMYVIGGGTNDIQRNLIARGLGLPR